MSCIKPLQAKKLQLIPVFSEQDGCFDGGAGAGVTSGVGVGVGSAV
jgi:hypothetical protein